jgi:hypothetical protein
MSENNYSLKNLENFNGTLDIDTNKIIQRYSELIIQYFKFITENKNVKTKNINLFGFIFTRGLETITNVFCYLLYYTKNIDITYFHSQKSFYFYVEFIGQISDEDNIFLQLSSRDASIYVYKKTIFEINLETKETLNKLSCEDKLNDKLNKISLYINLYKTFLYKIIQNNDFNSKYIDILQTIYSKLNTYNKTNNCEIIINKLDNLVDNMFHKINNVNIFFEIFLKLINKINKPAFECTLKKFNDKMSSDELNLYLDENNDNFLNWFFN